MTALPPGLLSLVEKATAEFFECTTVKSDPVQRVPLRIPMRGHVFSASLGFSGTTMKGAMVVVAHNDAIVATHPSKELVSHLPTGDRADWIGEIANQIVGNLKRLASGYGVDFLLSTPTVVHGNDMEVFNMGEKAAGFHTAIEGSPFSVFFTAVLDESVTFEGEPTATDQAQGGEAFLF